MRSPEALAVRDRAHAAASRTGVSRPIRRAATARSSASTQSEQKSVPRPRRNVRAFAAAGHRLPQLTTVKVPDGVDSASVRARLLREYGIEIGGGVGAFASTVWRIGCMGHTARRRNVTLLLAALAEIL